MDLAVAWLVFPAVLLVLAAGWGGVVTRLTAVELPRELVLPVGLAAVVVVSGIITTFSWAAQFATPVVVGGAAAGLAAAWPWRLPSRALVWPAGAAALVFAAYAAPIVLSGEATYAGYLTLDDTATLFAMTDRMLDEGRTLDGLAPSTYEATLSTSLMVGYPLGSLLPLGIGARLTGQDLAWVFQPYLAVLALMLALVLWRLLSSAVERRWSRLVAVVVAAQPAILYAYGLWVGVKELMAALLVGLAAALAFERRTDSTVRSWIPLATVVAALLGASSLGAAVWVVPLGVWLVVEARGAIRPRGVAVAAAALVVLALPAVAEAARWFDDDHITSLRDDDRLANLVQPLNPLQLFGIWPAGDFRLRPEMFWPTIVLIVLVAGLALAGLVSSLRRRDALVPYAACAVFGAVAYWALASPWIEAKAFAIASPALLALAASGCAWLARSGRGAEAAVAAALIAGGVLWSNTLAYRDVNLAPRDQLAELEDVGEDFAGQGPALITEYVPIGARHFLRRLDVEGASELRRSLVPLRNGSTLPKLQSANLDAFRLDGILSYRTLVLRRSPLESRPPAPYELRRRGRYYEVWQRPSTFLPVAGHVPLGGSSHPGGTAKCTDVERLAARATSVAAVPRDEIVLALPVPTQGQTLPFTLARGGRYSVWLGGSSRDGAGVLVDGRSIGRAEAQLNNLGQYTELARVVLAPGAHTVAIRFDSTPLRPGAGGPEYGRGPLVIAPTEPNRMLVALPSAEARRLCGRTLDWVEALG
jgi:hypothetical protein